MSIDCIEMNYLHFSFIKKMKREILISKPYFYEQAEVIGNSVLYTQKFLLIIYLFLVAVLCMLIPLNTK